MLEDLLEVVLSPWAVVVVLLSVLPDGRKLVRRGVNKALHVGYAVSDELNSIIEEVKEERNGKYDDVELIEARKSK